MTHSNFLFGILAVAFAEMGIVLTALV